jgi:hypothetical protein
MLASALKLQLEHASSFEDEGGTAGTAGTQGTPAAILGSWLRANRKAALSMKDRAALTSWPAQKSRSFWAYGRARAALAAELEPEGIQVPPIYLVSRDTAKKTLFVWDQGTPSVIPRTDLVLLRRERVRPGLLRSKRIVEEGVAGGDALAEILSPTGEVRSVPADLIVWRGGPGTPKSVEERIAALPLERPESVSRTELSHIIDVDLSTDPAEDVP